MSISKDRKVLRQGLLLTLIPLIVSFAFCGVLLFFVEKLAKSINDHPLSTAGRKFDSRSGNEAPELLTTVRQLIWLGVVLSALTGLLVLTMFRKNVLTPLEHVLGNIERLNSKEPLIDSLAGTDEFARMDKAIQKAQESVGRIEEILRETRDRVRILLDSFPIAVILCSSDGNIVMTNVAAEQVFGYRQEELIGWHISVLFLDTERDQKKAVMDSINSFVGRVQDLDAIRKDKSRAPVELSVSRIDMQGEQAVLIVALDVSERRAIEQLKKELMQMVSHDLRSPLASVLSGLELFRNGFFGQITEAGMQTMNKCDYEIQRLIQLVDQLLDLERIEAGQLEMRFEVTDLTSVLQQSISAISYLADKKCVEIVAPENSIDAFADGAKLIQVTINLLSNAIKFSPEKSKIFIEYRDNDDFVEVRIVDQGRGVAVANQKRIFERFAQSEQSDSDEKKGKGLGLAICKAIIEAHGGAIGVESEGGKGCAFWYRIPHPSEDLTG